MCARSSRPRLLVQHPRPFKADHAADVIPRIDDEDERVVEPVVDVLARLVRETEAEVEATVGQRKGTHVETDVAVPVARRPTDAAQIDGVARDERAGIVAELELQPRWRNPVGVDPDAELERL